MSAGSALNFGSQRAPSGEEPLKRDSSSQNADSKASSLAGRPPSKTAQKL
ncbi:MAG: hypothetical protein M0D55_20190 [Elusimicrobiota bacterium]|nr:MAG: hypothetical protein M0D55_20190 [Elusimicrobiota bacterium]